MPRYWAYKDVEEEEQREQKREQLLAKRNKCIRTSRNDGEDHSSGMTHGERKTHNNARR